MIGDNTARGNIVIGDNTTRGKIVIGDNTTRGTIFTEDNATRGILVIGDNTTRVKLHIRICAVLRHPSHLRQRRLQQFILHCRRVTACSLVCYGRFRFICAVVGNGCSLLEVPRNTSGARQMASTRV